MKPQTVRRNFFALTVLAIVGLATGCGAGSHAHSVVSATSSARTAATAADKQLTADGYAPFHIPGFGFVDIGIKSSAPKYQAVYTYKGNNQALVGVIVTDTQQKLAGTQGATVKMIGNLVIISANSESQLKAALKALLSSVPK